MPKPYSRNKYKGEVHWFFWVVWVVALFVSVCLSVGGK